MFLAHGCPLNFSWDRKIPIMLSKTKASNFGQCIYSLLNFVANESIALEQENDFWSGNGNELIKNRVVEIAIR